MYELKETHGPHSALYIQVIHQITSMNIRKNFLRFILFFKKSYYELYILLDNILKFKGKGLSPIH